MRRPIRLPNAGGQDGFRVGQTAKVRSGHRVQSLLKRGRGRQLSLPSEKIHRQFRLEQSGNSLGRIFLRL